MELTDFLCALEPLFATVITVIVAIIIIIIKIHGSRVFDKKRKYHPVAGTVIHQMFNFHRLLEFMVDLARQGKTYRLLSFIRSEVYTANPANIEHILVTNFANYGKEGKFCFSDDTWPDGYSVRKGDLVSFQPYVMGRMKFLWGEDAEKFRPERWLDENGILQKHSSFKFTAFQAAEARPRICLGKEFAYRQMKIYSTVLLGSHSFKLADQNKSVKYKTMLTLQIDGGLRVCAFQREK